QDRQPLRSVTWAKAVVAFQGGQAVAGARERFGEGFDIGGGGEGGEGCDQFAEGVAARLGGAVTDGEVGGEDEHGVVEGGVFGGEVGVGTGYGGQSCGFVGVGGAGVVEGGGEFGDAVEGDRGDDGAFTGEVAVEDGLAVFDAVREFAHGDGVP